MEDSRARWVVPLGLSVAMLLALALRWVLVWSQLPEPFASHFGRGGQPDAFTSKLEFVAVMLVVGVGSIAIVFASPFLLRITPPSLISLPNRDYWLATHERREEAIDRLAGLMGWIGAATTALLVIAVELTIQANLERQNLDETTFLACLAAYFVFVIAVLARLFRVFERPPSDQAH